MTASQQLHSSASAALQRPATCYRFIGVGKGRYKRHTGGQFNKATGPVTPVRHNDNMLRCTRHLNRRNSGKEQLAVETSQRGRDKRDKRGERAAAAAVSFTCHFCVPNELNPDIAQM